MFNYYEELLKQYQRQCVHDDKVWLISLIACLGIYFILVTGTWFLFKNDKLNPKNKHI